MAELSSRTSSTPSRQPVFQPAPADAPLYFVKMSFSGAIRDRVLYSAKHAIWRTMHRHSLSTKQPIFLFTSRRSGGTWLAESLAVEEGLLSITQPFSIGMSDPFHRARGVFPPSVYRNQRVPVRPDDEEWMKEFLQRMLDGELKIEQPANFLARSFNSRTNRVLIKLHNAKSWIDWIQRQFPAAKMLFHLRHPVPQALSAMRRPWPNRTAAYLNDRTFVSRFLDPAAETETKRILTSGTPFEQWIANWCVENLAPLRLLNSNPRPDWLVTTYEELVANPEALSSLIARRLELSSLSAIRKGLCLPSRTTYEARTRSVIKDNPNSPTRRAYLLDRWQPAITKEQTNQARRLLDLFGISAYAADSTAPSQHLLNLPK